jgi:tRNA/tmRNA/rRNA uracil-C5-methylase (TrmA/RlmC/RlmD family)
MAGMKQARFATLGTPAFAGDFGIVRLSVQLPVQFECGVAAQNNAVEGHPLDASLYGGLGLRACEQLNKGLPVEGACGGGDRVFVNSGGKEYGLDAGRAQGGKPRGRGRCEIEAHGDSYARGMGEMLGKTIELDVTNIAHGGVSVARYDGRVVFVADAIPGERVRARVSADSKKSFWRAETVEVLEPSAHRVPHVWEEASLERDPADRAGGAEFGHIELAHQRELKRQVIVDSLKRMAKLDSDVVVEAVDGDEQRGGIGWRTRVRLHVDESGRVGPYAARSHRVIGVSSLPLATAELVEGAPLRENFAGHEHVDILAPSTGGVRLIIGDQKTSVITEIVGEREFRLADRGFWQVHRGAAATLTAAVQDAIDPALFEPHAANLDLYGGVGLFAAAVADKFGPATRITSVESDSVATDFASGNLVEWIGAHAETGRVERWIAALAASASASERARLAKATIVLDPPRAGAGRQVVDSLAALHPAQIVYVACDPVAFARDVDYFAGHGYELTRLRAFDLFPSTHHVEAVGTLSRR